MEIKILNYNFSICKVEDYSQVKLDKELCFIGKTDEVLAKKGYIIKR